MVGLGKPHVQVVIELSHSQAVTLVSHYREMACPDCLGPIRDCSRLTANPEVIPKRDVRVGDNPRTNLPTAP